MKRATASAAVGAGGRGFRHLRRLAKVAAAILLLAVALAAIGRDAALLPVGGDGEGGGDAVMLADQRAMDPTQDVDAGDIIWMESRQEIYAHKHWHLQLLQGGDRVDCNISTAPLIPADDGGSPAASLLEGPVADEYTAAKDQYVIHVHGLHHTGTGYLRQTLLDALNSEFGDPASGSRVASGLDSMRPYRHLLQQAGQNRTRKVELYSRYHVPEDEGQHLQSVYPRVADRVKELPRLSSRNAHRLAYLADFCIANGGGADGLDDRDSNRKVGNMLLRQWLPYWDASATFLLQKTPSLDVMFLEATKVLPTLHVIVVRHPMTSNSWG